MQCKVSDRSVIGERGRCDLTLPLCVYTQWVTRMKMLKSDGLTGYENKTFI